MSNDKRGNDTKNIFWSFIVEVGGVEYPVCFNARHRKYHTHRDGGSLKEEFNSRQQLKCQLGAKA